MQDILRNKSVSLYNPQRTVGLQEGDILVVRTDSISWSGSGGCMPERYV